jgi:nitrogen fixation/metabolism regulation signal transduction histidine kinase
MDSLPAEFGQLLRRARRSGSASAEVRLRGRDGREVPVAVSVSAIEDADGQRAGAVMTIEDLSELIMAERAAAWSEVARRMAHEIKNPLTPIQISAERIARNFTRKDRSSEHLQRVIAECTATIVREVGSLQRMVEEFSKFARLPQPKFAPTDLNGVVATTASLYEERLDGASLELRLAERLPALMLDAEQIKRVIVNLVDNALEAVREAAERRITVETSHDRSRDIVRLVVSDTGHGLDGADVTRLFLPYFSTRSRGTGLGLAIVSHIVSEHHGAVRAEGNEPCGARFIVEFPAGEVEPAVQERPELVGRAS